MSSAKHNSTMDIATGYELDFTVQKLLRPKMCLFTNRSIYNTRIMNFPVSPVRFADNAMCSFIC